MLAKLGRLDWRWLFFQLFIPLVAPAVMAAIFVLAWWSLKSDFAPRLEVILDLTPWAIVTYSLALIGGTFDRSWSNLSKAALSGLWLTAAANAVYYALLVIRRHDPTFEVRADAYYVTLVLMLVSLFICYRAR